MHIKSIITSLLITASTISCAQSSTELVYDTREILQCEEATNISPSQSAKILTDSGIQVIETFCGAKTGMVVIAMCGVPSLSIILHEILINDVDGAEMRGFARAATLIDSTQGIGYELTDC